MASPIRNPWWFRPFNLLYKWFGIMISFSKSNLDTKWMIVICRVRKKDGVQR